MYLPQRLLLLASLLHAFPGYLQLLLQVDLGLQQLIHLHAETQAGISMVTRPKASPAEGCFLYPVTPLPSLGTESRQALDPKDRARASLRVLMRCRYPCRGTVIG